MASGSIWSLPYRHSSQFLSRTGVGIDEGQPAAAGPLGSQIACGSRPQAVRATDQLKLGIVCLQGSRETAGRGVNHHDLVRQGGLLPPDRAEGPFNGGLALVGGDHKTDVRRLRTHFHKYDDVAWAPPVPGEYLDSRESKSIPDTSADHPQTLPLESEQITGQAPRQAWWPRCSTAPARPRVS